MANTDQQSTGHGGAVGGAHVQTNIFGSVNSFNPAVEDWANYKRRFEIWCLANNVKGDQQKAVFLSCVGPEPFELLTSLVLPDDIFSKSYDDLTKMLGDYYKPKRNVISERKRFRECKQTKDESVNDYVLRLNACRDIVNLAKICSRI